MRRNKLPILVGSICLVLILATIPFMAACAKPAPSPEEPIKIGALLPLTGPFALWGSWFERAHKFALDEAGWEVAGRPIEFIIEDEGGEDVTVMMEKLRKLVEADKIHILTGPFFGPMGPPAAAYVSKVPIPRVDNHAAERPELEYDYWFDGSQAYIDHNYLMGKYAYEELGVRTVTTIAWDFQCPRDFVEGFAAGFEGAGGTVVQQQWTEIGAADYTPYLLALEEADALSEAVCGGDTSTRLLSQAHELGIHEKFKEWFVGGQAELESPELLAELGDRGLGVYYIGFYSPLIDTPVNKQFVEKFKAKFGMLPSAWDALKYENILIILAALEATGGDTDPAKLKKALLELKLELPSGPFSFDEGRLGIRNHYIMRIEKVAGEYVGVIVKTFTEVHTRAPIYPYP